MTDDTTHHDENRKGDAADETEVTSPAAMVTAAEAVLDQPDSAPPLEGSLIEHEAAWRSIKEGVGKHERGTFKLLMDEQRIGGVSDKIKSHDPADGAFLWMTAIEGSTIPQMNVDQMDWTQHYNFWRQDLRRVRAELGVKYLRVSPPWYKLNPGPGIYDWQWWDEYTDYAVNKLGFDLMVDLVHFGTPLWMLEQFAHPDFAPRLADYASAFARRYRGAIRSFVPVNEPYITALFGGDLGCWPPFHSGEASFPPMMTNITKGIVQASQAIRAEQPESILMYVDTTENAWSPDPELDATVAQRNERRFISYDMALGRIDEKHPLRDWLLRNNMREDDLAYFQSNPAPVDIIGLDYYPQSEAVLTLRNPGRNLEYKQKDMMGVHKVDLLWDPEHLAPTDRAWPIGFYGVAKEYQARYGKPIMLAETNWNGGPLDHRLRWMNYMLDDCKRLRAEGFPLIGYCWWGAYDHMDWGLALRLHSGKVHHVGLWNLQRKDWVLRRVRSGLFDRYRYAIHHTDEIVGPYPLRADSVMGRGG